MNAVIKLPATFEPQREIAKKEYFLEILAPKHNEIDYEAWTSSRVELQGVFGPAEDWPPYEYSKEQNLEDFERHYMEFENKIAYAYTILSPDKLTCIGCLYIRPTKAKDYDVRVDFWFRNSHRHIECLFFEELEDWLEKDWDFKNVAYPGRRLSWEEYNKLLEES